MKQLFPIFILIHAFAISAFSQNNFSAIVVNQNNSPILESLIIYIDNDGRILESLSVDSTGYFNVPNVNFNIGKIIITALGYESKEIDQFPKEKNVRIVLQGLSVVLDELIISGESSIVQKDDRLVFNITSEKLTKGNNSFELLKMAPLVQEKNNSISILGKESILLYINGRKSNLSTEALQNYLQSLPAENISSIEVITNPGVIYSTSGNQGVINLVLKKNEVEGLKGTFRIEDSQRKKTNSQNGNLYLDYQNGNFNLTSGIYADNRNSYSENMTDYYFYNNNRYDSGKNEVKNKNLSIGTNVRADYKLSENQTIGTLLDFLYYEGKNNSTTNTLYYGSINSSKVDSTYDSYNKSTSPMKRLSVNLNYRAKLSQAGSTFSMDIDYLKNNRKQTIFNEFYRLPSEVLPVYEFKFNQESGEFFDSYSAKTVYYHVINTKQNVTGGIELYSSTSKSDFNYTSLIENQHVPDPSKNNSFNYKEMYLSAYISYNWILNKKIRGGMGLKVEKVKSEGIQKITNEKIERNDLDWIPNFSMLYEINPNNRLSYNLISFAARPGYFSLNPFRFFLTPNTYREYNPNLKTGNAYIQNLLYTLKRKYTFSLSYMYISNPTNNFFIPVDDHCTKLLNANYSSLNSVSFGFSWNSTLLDDRLSVNASTNANYRKDKGQVETILIDNEGFSYNLSLYSNVVLSKHNNWNLIFQSSYMSAMKLAHEEISDRYNVSIGIRKVFLNNISLNFGINNLLTNSFDIREKTTANYKYSIKNKYYFHTAYVSVSVPFGNQKTRGAQNRSTSSTDISKRLQE